MKKFPIYTIEREFLGSISIPSFLARIVCKHLQSEKECGEISYEKRMAESG